MVPFPGIFPVPAGQVPLNGHAQDFGLAATQGEGQFFQEVLVPGAQPERQFNFVRKLGAYSEPACGAEVEESFVKGLSEKDQNPADYRADSAGFGMAALIGRSFQATAEADRGFFSGGSRGFR